MVQILRALFILLSLMMRLLLNKLTQVTDSSKVDITVSMKGKETTTTYEGKDALFESPSYSYYMLSEVPSYYKRSDC